MSEFMENGDNGQMTAEDRHARFGAFDGGFEEAQADQNEAQEPFHRQDLGQIADAQYPPLEFILPDRQVMPRGAVTILSGQGGLGKSGIMLQLGSARSLSSQWLGEQVLPGRTLYFNYEDTARVVSDRGRRIAEHYDCATGDLSEFEVIDRAADGDEWVSFLSIHGKMQTTKEYDRAVATIEAAKADLVVIDGVSQVCGGNDIDKR
jgi:RecA-family ATPase